MKPESKHLFLLASRFLSFFFIFLKRTHLTPRQILTDLAGSQNVRVVTFGDCVSHFHFV